MSKEITIFSWNINGLRAIYKRGFLNWLIENNPYILCLQETRIMKDEIPMELVRPQGYHAFWNCSQIAGYSGTAIFTKELPIRVENHVGIKKFDEESRMLLAEYNDFILINCYSPNGRPDNSRVNFKVEFFDALLELCKKLIEKKDIIVCGDLNVAHNELDLSDPKSNINKSGFLRIERNCLDKFIDNGFFDVFRNFYPNVKGRYTWWNRAGDFKARNFGWRFDYFFASNGAMEKINSSEIFRDVDLSDHCPISINYQIENPREEFVISEPPGFLQTKLFN